MSLWLRRAEVTDATAIARLQVACWRENFRALIDAAALYSMSEPEWAARRAACLVNPERFTVVAGEGREILGFGEGGPVRDSLWAPAGEVISLFVRPGAQGKGIGRLLFKALAEELRALGFARLVVKTLRDAPASRGFYELQGCALLGESSFEFGGKRYAEAVYGKELLS